MKTNKQDIDDLEFHHILINDKEAFTPPKEAKEAVFAALNLSKYSAVPATISGTSKFANILKKAIIPAAAGLIVAVSSYLYLDKNETKSEVTRALNYTINTTEAVMNTSTSQSDNNSDMQALSRLNVPIARSEKLSNQIRKINFAPRSSQASYYSKDDNVVANREKNDANDARIVDNTVNNANLAQEAETETISKKDFFELSGSPINVQNQKISMKFSPFDPSDYINKGRSTDIELMVKGVGGSAVIADNMPINDFANSFAVGGYLPIKDDKSLLIGFVAGKEQYAKKYFNREDSKKVDYSGVVSSLWLGISAKYRFDEVATGTLFSFEPFAEVGLGAGEIGPLSRASVGIEKDIFSSISANISADFSSMFYNNRYDWFASKKFGISAGIVVKM